MTTGKTKQQTTTQTTSPPWYIANQQQYAVDEARRLYDEGLPAYYPGDALADLSPETLSSWQMISDRASAGSPLVQSAQGSMLGTLRGDYLNSNPHLDSAIDRASEGVVRNYSKSVFPTIAGDWTSSGRFGSGLYADAQSDARGVLADTLGDVAGNMTMANYGNERANMMTAAGMAPGLASMDYVDAGMMGSIGAAREGQAQSEIDADMQKYSYESTADINALNQFLQQLGVVTPGAGSTMTMTQPVAKANPWAQALGLGMTGIGLYGNRNNIMGGWGF